MELEMAKQATADQPASTGATTKAARSRSTGGAKAREGSATSAKPKALPVDEKNPKKQKRANRATKPVDVSPEPKPKKAKVVRDSFTMPEDDYRKFAELKERCLAGGHKVKKSELLRAGLSLLASLPAKRLLAAVASVESVKTGRPSKA